MNASTIKKLTVSITNVGVIQKGDKLTKDFHGIITHYTVTSVRQSYITIKDERNFFVDQDKEFLDWMIKGDTGRKVRISRDIMKPLPEPWNNFSDT